ncbi:hypothetical protein LSAT2_029901 [Lamellibrachia satsuma]|nr:hypothetical protein LSAT2_029901 [Lamellibrachia satsuma]
MLKKNEKQEYEGAPTKTASRNIRSANQTSTITGASLRWTWTSRSHNVQNACDQAQSNRRYCKRIKVPPSTGMYYQTHYGTRPLGPVAAVASATVSGRPCRCLDHGCKKQANHYITEAVPVISSLV